MSLGEKLVIKMREELSSNHPYEAMLYVQTFVARKRRSISPLESCELVLRGIDALVEARENEYAGTLYEWLLKQSFLDSNEIFQKVFQETLQLISKGLGDFVGKIFTPLTGFIEGRQSLSQLERTRLLYELNQRCGEIFEQTKRWRDAKNSYLSIGDISSVVRIVHLWSEEGYPSEYPLFFVRVYLYLLVNRLVPQAAAFFRAACDEYLDSYELSVQPSTQSHQVYSLWQMCVIINDLLSLMDTPSSAAKITPSKIYTQIILRFTPLLESYDPSLCEAAKLIGHRIFSIPQEKSQQEEYNPMAMVSKLLGGFGPAPGR